ncbi:hypothetical protein A2Z33_02735 [Candidatus Gottesmanbacteria bacterium RBG_16_52_11]|uniref:Thioredoxin domain-containing protein n=1 Tax=Candidatus Gottesmanbacteria bacterium RBG_16_52_11 TaxID=1798374 RepID=A0A1F5YN82_9BACT|nr:MAG: hypothetical protein A2Z33_02735 [Candidatus Gottesmanbacteria bacterium RBG_16_52_11]
MNYLSAYTEWNGDMEKMKTKRETYTELPQVNVTVTATPLTLAFYVFVALLVIAAFLLGQLTARVQSLSKGTTQAPTQAGTAKAASKYPSFDEAIKALAKDAGLDSGKLLTCMNSGEKQALVDADSAYAQSVGVNGTPAFFINGRMLAGAFPYESFKEIIDREIAGTGSDEAKSYTETLQKAADQQAFVPKKATIETGKGVSRGPAQAGVTIIEFSDFQCPYCSRAFPTTERIMKDYDGKVKLVYRHMPLSMIHPRAQKAAEASECARDQGKFWEFHDQLFKNQQDWSVL